MWKSGNCIFARERTSKSSFLGSAFHDFSLFFYTCCRNLWLPPFIEGIIHIILNLWTHLASHLRPKFPICCTPFFWWFFRQILVFKAKPRKCPWRHPEGEGGTLRRNHWKENHRGEIIEQRSIWEASGTHMGGIRDTSGRHLGLQEAMGFQGHKNRCPSRLECKSDIRMLILHCVF